MRLEDLSFATHAYNLLKNVLTELTTYLLAHCVGALRLEKKALTLLTRAVEEEEFNSAVFAFDKLAEFGFGDKNCFLWLAAPRTLHKCPVDFAAVLKADMSVESFACFDGSLGDAFAAGTENLSMEIIGGFGGGLRHLKGI